MKKIFTFVVILILLSFNVLAANETNSTNFTKRDDAKNQSFNLNSKCDDGLDNDGDGLVDYDGNGDIKKKDPGCFGPADSDESGGAKPPVDTKNKEETNVANNESSGGSIPWDLVIGLATPTLFFLAGIAGNDKASDLAKDKFKGVASNQLAGVVGPTGPEILQGLTFVANPGFGPGDVLAQYAKGAVSKEVLTQLAKAEPRIGWMLQIKSGIDELYNAGKVGFGGNYICKPSFVAENKGQEVCGWENPPGSEKNHFEINSEGNVNFKNIDFIGKDAESVDASKYFLNEKLAKEEGNEIKLKGFKGTKENGITELSVTSSDENLVINLKDKRPISFTGMKKGSIIKLNDEGEVTEANIVVDSKSGSTYVLGNKAYELPEGANIIYNGEESLISISELKGREVFIDLPLEDGSFNRNSAGNSISVNGEDDFFIDGTLIEGTGDDVIISVAGRESINIGSLSDGSGNVVSPYTVDIVNRQEGTGFLVKKGIAVKDDLLFEVEKESQSVLILDTDVDDPVFDYCKANKITCLRKIEDSLIVNVGAEENRELKFEVQDTDTLIRGFSTEGRDIDLSFNLGSGSEMEVFPPPVLPSPEELYLPRVNLNAQAWKSKIVNGNREISVYPKDIIPSVGNVKFLGKEYERKFANRYGLSPKESLTQPTVPMVIVDSNKFEIGVNKFDSLAKVVVMDDGNIQVVESSKDEQEVHRENKLRRKFAEENIDYQKALTNSVISTQDPRKGDLDQVERADTTTDLR